MVIATDQTEGEIVRRGVGRVGPNCLNHSPKFWVPTSLESSLSFLSCGGLEGAVKINNFFKFKEILVFGNFTSRG